MNGSSDLTNISPDQILFWEAGVFNLNATILFTWIVMGLIALGSWCITRNLKVSGRIPRWQNLLEIIVDGIRKQIAEISQQKPDRYIPFVGTLFLFIFVSNLLAIVPGFRPPTASLSTTAALAGCVFFAVPIFGISRKGFAGYLKHYVQPTPLMLPFNIIGELSRTLALAVRLFGNMMSGTKIAAIFLAITPLFFPIVMQALGLLTGLIQAYIFAVLTVVYLAAATRPDEDFKAVGEPGSASGTSLNEDQNSTKKENG